ncbi:hypothetical protein RHSIM_Rhsim06G0025900 [Rhododendron simsii]|uniref:Uncharacterized protein n=1 Tax=Rhododendron simsii TaxID=118357 RepID=A0A834LN67_RHOSS|nr:hypothetical protein RHSIM_Rhsim06G0025900 [Rhododendron simsii]
METTKRKEEESPQWAPSQTPPPSSTRRTRRLTHPGCQVLTSSSKNSRTTSPGRTNIILKSYFFSTKKFRTTFTDCATIQANSPETNVAFTASVAMNGLNRTIAVAVKLNRQ